MTWVIRTSQLEAMRNAKAREFCAEAEVRLRARFPEECHSISPEEMKALLHRGLVQAARYAIVEPAQVERFFGYLITLGQDFDERSETAWAGYILRRSDASALAKLEALEAQVAQLKRGAAP